MTTSNIIDTISLIRKNQQFFQDNSDYCKILTNLYKELSEKNKLVNQNLEKINFNSLKLDSKDFLTEEEYILILNFIANNVKNISYFFEIKNIELIIKKLPLFSLYFNVHYNFINESLNINYNICDCPILTNEYEKHILVLEIKMLLKMCDLSCSNTKIIILIIIYDLIMRNFKFVLDNEKFGKTCFDKLKEVKLNNIDKFQDISLKCNIDSKLIDKWIEAFENLYI